MNEAALYRITLWAWLVLSVITFGVLFIRTAPYGRHQQRGWGPGLSPRVGWIVMELPAVIIIAAFLLPVLLRERWPQGWLLLGLWELHYVHRALAWPFRIRSTKPMPLVVVALGCFFQLMNGWLNGRGLTIFGPELGRAALTDPRVLLGAAIFVVGIYINLDADTRLLRLPRSADGGYSIPHGGLYELISCPNYLGELLEWLGFAIAAGSLGALSFFVWTAANLLPRAHAHHRWYREHFPDYPRRRRAVIPWVW